LSGRRGFCGAQQPNGIITAQQTKVLEISEEIFVDQLVGWYTDTATWPEDCSYDVFCRWFDYRHHSTLVDLCPEGLRAEVYR